MIYAKKLKKKCMVRGCGNIESFALTKSLSDIGNVFICASCLAEGLSQVDEARKNFDETRADKPEKASAPPPLFYHPTVIKPIIEADTASEEVAESVDDVVDDMVDDVVDEVENAVDGEDTVNDIAEDSVEPSEPSEPSEEQPQFICAVCGKAFGTLKGLNMHAKVHSGE